MHCRMFNGISGLSSLNISTLPLVVTIKCVSRHCHMSPDKNNVSWGEKPPSLEIHWISLYLSLEEKGHLSLVPGMLFI